jgi:hypothetical protein
MSKLLNIIRHQRRQTAGTAITARGPRVLMLTIWEPVLSPTGSVVGKQQTGARAEILGDPHRRTWEQHDESLEAFETRVEKEAEALDLATNG